MAVKLKDLLPLIGYCAAIISDEDNKTICWDYSRIDCRYWNKEEQEQERKECEEILAPYMDCEVKTIEGIYDGQCITIKGKKVMDHGK